jgi:DNA-binding NtrC family response regulator
MTFDQIKGESENHDSQPDNKLGRTDVKPEGPILGIFSRNPAQKPDAICPGNAQKHIRLLAVEDEDTLRKLLGRILPATGVSFDMASSLEEANAKLDSAPECKILLTDFYLANNNSVHSIPLIQKAKGRGMKVILMSGTMQKAMEEFAESKLDINALVDAFIEKPYDVDRLIAVLTPFLKSGD